MHDTVFDYIKLIFPETTRPTGNDELAAVSGSANEVGSQTGWLEAPWFPTDLFAVSAFLLDTSSAFSHFEPDPEAEPPLAARPWFNLNDKDREFCEKVGQEWILLHSSQQPADTPIAVQELWRQLIEESSAVIRLPLRNKSAPKWWLIALKLMIMSDEASEGIGRPLLETDPLFKTVILGANLDLKEFSAAEIIDEAPLSLDESEVALKSSIAASPRKKVVNFQRAAGSSASFGVLANSNVVNVFPKSRLSASGCSHRNFCRNLTMLPKSGSVRCHWHMPVKPLLDDDDMPVDILIVPYPFSIAAKSFKPSQAAKDSMPGGSKFTTRPNWGNFTLNQDWLLHEDIIELAKALLKSARNDVESVNGVMLPEYALTFSKFEELCLALKEIEPRLEFVVSGSSSNCDPEVDGPGNYAMTAVWHDFGDGALTIISSRKKHHRWMLSPGQLETYALTSTLDPRINWWESHNIGQRELHFHPFRKSSLFTAMICEDLARSDPCHEVLRSVAPNLVFVLLMDGPQIAQRWSARYAAALSDDPGCSVLTLTCFGLVERSNQTRMHKKQEAIAYFSSPFGQTPIHLPYNEGARGVLITLTSVQERPQQTIDGRSSKDSRAWKLTSTQPVKP